MATTRDYKAPPIMALNAETTIPQTPVAGVAYRKDDTPDSVIEDGFRYNTIIPSASLENQFQFLLSQITKTIEQQGILGWCNLVDYPINSFSVGSDGILYQAIQASGPNNGGSQDPITAVAFWKDFADSVVGLVPVASESEEGIIQIANQSEAEAGTNDTKAMTPFKINGLFDAQLSANGYQRLPSGLLMQWGTYSGSTGQVTINFPTPYTSNVFHISLQGLATQTVAGPFNNQWINSSTTNNFTIYKESNQTINWFSLGV